MIIKFAKKNTSMKYILFWIVLIIFLQTHPPPQGRKAVQMWPLWRSLYRHGCKTVAHRSSPSSPSSPEMWPVWEDLYQPLGTSQSREQCAQTDQENKMCHLRRYLHRCCGPTISQDTRTRRRSLDLWGMVSEILAS